MIHKQRPTCILNILALTLRYGGMAKIQSIKKKGVPLKPVYLFKAVKTTYFYPI